MRCGRDRHAFLVEVIRHLSLVTLNANKWSVGKQTTGQVECKWVSKSVQLPSTPPKLFVDTLSHVFRVMTPFPQRRSETAK